MTTATLAPSKPKRVYTDAQKRKISDRQKIYYDENRTLICAKVQARRKSNPTRHKSNRLKSTYGITLAQRDALFSSQGSVCAICKTTEPGSKLGWATDHCHAGGHVRGILCHQCNVMLGMSKDNPATLLAAITYLAH